QLATGVARDELRGKIVLAPPMALADRWTRRLPDPVIALASGWMRVKQRAKARGIELPASHLRPCRLGRADPDAGRCRRARDLGDAWPRGSARPLRRAARARGPRAGVDRLRRGGRVSALARVATGSSARALHGRQHLVGARE